MSAMFDTLKYSERLERAGIPHSEAVAFAEAQVESLKELAEARITKADLESALAPIKTDIAVLKWGVGVILAINISLAIKAFF